MRRCRLILFLLCFFILFSCSNQENKEKSSVSNLIITSPLENQICRTDSFEMSSIWIDVTYASGMQKQMTLSKDMLSKEDYSKLSQSGEHTITIHIGDKSIDLSLFLYDESTLDQAHIFCFDINQFSYVIADSIYDIEVPIKEDSYFYNWYVDEKRTIPYQDTMTDEVIPLYANFTKEKTYRVRFYHQDVLMYEEYVLKGDSATPPMMVSFDSYFFVGWDKSFSNIQEDTDIYSVYMLPSSKIIYYDYYGEVLLEEDLVPNEEVKEPVPPIVKGFKFMGWNRVVSEDHLEVLVYPIYQKESYEIRFYKDSIDNYLYSQWVYAGEDAECIYEVENYYISGYSSEIHQINESKDVIVFYSPVEYQYYENGTLLFTLPFYEIPPKMDLNKTYKWVQREDTVFDLVFDEEKQFTIKCDTFEYGVEEVNLLDFLTQPKLYLGGYHQEYAFYNWYYDVERQNQIEDFTKLIGLDCIYGKRVSFLEQSDYSFIEFEECEIEGQQGYKAVYNPNRFAPYLAFPGQYNSHPVLEIEIKSSNRSIEYIFLPNTILEFTYLNSSHPKEIILEEGSLSFYSRERILYKRDQKGDILYLCPSELNRFEYKEELIHPTAFYNTKINDFYIAEGIRVFDDKAFLGCSIDTLYLSNTLEELNVVHLFPKNIELQDCSLKKINLAIVTELNQPFVLPKTVQFLDCILSNHSVNDLQKLVIPEDHPYFKIKEDSLLVDAKEEILVKFLKNQTNYTIHGSIKYLFANCFSGVEMNQIVFHKNLLPCVSYHGFTSAQTEFDLFTDSKVNSVITPIQLDMPFSPSLRNTVWFTQSQDNFLLFGNTLVLINNIKGNYTLSKEIKKISSKIIGRNVDVETLYIPKGILVEEDAFQFADDLDNGVSKIRNVVMQE